MNEIFEASTCIIIVGLHTEMLFIKACIRPDMTLDLAREENTNKQTKSKSI